VGPVISTVPGAILGVRFDDVRVGKSTDEEVLITNKGDFPLMITSLVVTNTGVKEVSESVITVVNPPEFPKELSVGTTLSLTLRFTPEDRDGVGGLLLIGSDTVGGAGPPPIFGQGLAAGISIEVTATDAVVAHDGSNRLMLETVSYDFGSVPVGTSASAKVSIANEHGNTPLRIGIEEINNPHFRWENYPEGGVVDLDARTSSSLILTFEPKSHGVKTAGFVVESDAHNATRTDVTLTGRGVGPAMQVEIADTARRPDAEFMVRQFGREFHFGEWQVSSTASVKVRISNRGNAPLDLDMTKPVEVETTEADFQFLDRNPTPTRKLRPTVGDRHTPPYLVGESAPTIAAGSSSTFMLHFKPSVPSLKDNGRLVINSNDPGHPEWKLNLEGSGRGALMRITLVTSDAAYVHPTQTHVHDVGEIRVNHRLAWDDLFVRLQNLGNENLNVSLEMAEGSEGFSIGNWNGQHTFVEKHAQWIQIIFEPTRPGPHTGAMIIESNDDFLREFRIQVRGRGLAPDIDVQAVDFGDVQVDGSSSAEVVVHNRGGLPLRITDVEMGANDQFSDNTDSFTCPNGLHTQKTTTFTGSFAPTAVGASSTTLTCASNAYGKNSHAVTLKGRGRGKPRMEVEIAGSVRRHESAYSFSKRRVGMTESVAVKISNMGNGDLRIESIGTTSTGFRFIDRPASGILRIHPPLSERHELGYTLTATGAQTIAASSSSTVMLHFSPSLPSRRQRLADNPEQRPGPSGVEPEAGGQRNRAFVPCHCVRF